MRLRPRFRYLVPLCMEELTGRLRVELEKPGFPITGEVLSEFAVLKIPEQDQHYWSPELTLQLHKEGEGTLVRALFGPRPAVWTMFAGFYLFAAFVSLIALMFGLSQWSLNMTPYGLWLLPVTFVLLISAYAIAMIGQRLGYAQMKLLRDFLEETLEISVVA